MMAINQRSRKPFRGALEAADLSDLISPAVKYSRDRTSALRGLFGGNGRDDFDFLLAGATAAIVSAAFFGFFPGATEVFTAGLAFFEAFLGMIAENDHWGRENSLA
jgi:hypothetical protein